MIVNRERLLQQLILHEGLKLEPYTSTLGNSVIGIGYNITSRGWVFLEQVIGRKVGKFPRLTPDEARAVCRADIDRMENAMMVHFPSYSTLDDVRQRVILDMAFNVGFTALGFKQTIEAIAKHDWSRAAREMYKLKSKWPRQGRCDRLFRMLLTGVDFTF